MLREEVEQQHTAEVEVVLYRQSANIEGQADIGEEIKEIIVYLENMNRNTVHEEESLLQYANVEDDDDDNDDDDDVSSKTVMPDQ